MKSHPGPATIFASLLSVALFVIFGYSPASSQATASVSGQLSVAGDPAGGATWLITLDVPYCGGYQVGDGVYLQLLDPYAWPDAIPSDGVTFADGPATSSVNNGVLQIGPAPGRFWAQFCQTDSATTPLQIVLAPSVGLGVPPDGTNVLQAWTGQAPVPTQLTATVN